MRIGPCASPEMPAASTASAAMSAPSIFDVMKEPPARDMEPTTDNTRAFDVSRLGHVLGELGSEAAAIADLRARKVVQASSYQWKETPAVRWWPVSLVRSRAVSVTGTPPKTVPGTLKVNSNVCVVTNLYSAQRAMLRVTSTRMPPRNCPPSRGSGSGMSLVASRGLAR